MKSFFDYSLTEFKKLACWNLNFDRFEGLNRPRDTYLQGCRDSFCVLVEEFSEHPSKKKFYADDRIEKICLGSEAAFTEIFSLEEKASQVASFSLTEAYWEGVDDVYLIHQFLKNYSHDKLVDGEIVLLSAALNTPINRYRISIGNEIKAVNEETNRNWKEPFLNPTGRNFVFLDEIFSLKDLYLGIGFPLKRIKKQNIWDDF